MNGGKFEPNIIAFACAWGGWKAAIAAGKARIRYPSNVRTIRVSCTGSIDPALFMQAFEKGVDGVLIVGCRADECHFATGNKKMEERLGHFKRLMCTLGLNPSRIRAEGIAPIDGSGYADLIARFVEEIRLLGPVGKPIHEEPRKVTHEWIVKEVNRIVEDTKAFKCVECGRCTSVCPIPKFEPEFAMPRMVVLRSIEGMADNLADDKDIWICTTCGLCNSMCPFKVDYCGFIQGLRTHARMLGHQPTCAHRGLVHSAMRMMANSDLKQNRLQWLPEECKVSEKSEVFYFVGCLPHFDAIFADRNLGLTNIPAAAVKLMNAAGITPQVSDEERCCGHDLIWTGDEDNFLKLMDKNLDLIRRSGAKKVVFSCPECYRTFSVDYKEFEGDLGFEIQHISEYLFQLMQEGKLKFPKSDKAPAVTYHDSCRLGIHMGVIDPPRRLLEAGGMKILEMENTKNRSYCCGNCAWTNCSSTTMKMQLERMKEAKRTGADFLLTADPKCQIHLSCATSGEIPLDRGLVDIPVKDISVALAELLGNC